MKKAITSFSIRAAALLAFMVLTILIAPSEARADASGYCGTNGHETEVSWSYNATTATLTISGTGAIRDYNEYALRPGWDVYKPLIKKVVINNGVTAIGKYAFSRFYTMPDITIPASITTIGDDAFLYCSGIKSVTFAGGSQLTEIGDEAFFCCIGLTSITIPDHVETIGASTFMGCFNLTSITIPASMTTIGDDAFYECNSMADVYCYVADPAALTWEEGGTLIDFMAGKATKCHVFDKAAFDAKWAKGENTDVNVTFVGDLCTTPVNYIDADGRQQSCRAYTILTGGGSTTLDGGWYIVDDNIYYTTTGTSEESLVFSGDAHIILCGKNALTTHGSIKSTGSLTIYCQSSSKCSLTVDCDADAHGLYAENGSVTINGGTVIIESNNGDGIRASGDITINGGIVTAMSSNGNGIRTTGGDITLGYRDGSDQITANSYVVINGKAVKIADGKHYIVNSNLYIGTLTSEQKSAIGGQDLESPNNYLVKIYDDNTYCIKIKFAGDANYRTWENADYSLTPQPGEDCFYFVVDKSLVGSTVELLGTDDVTEADVHGEWKPADARFIVTDCNGAPVSVAYTYGNDPNNLDLDCGHKNGSFIMPAKDVDVCVKAYMPIPYVDENGDTRVLRDGYVLLPQPWEQVGLSFYGSGVPIVSEWYVGYGDVDSDTFGGITFKENSDTKLILCDGADIQIRGCIACSNLTIYGQSNGTGRLTITANKSTVHCITFNSNYWDDNGRYGADLSIYGGTVSVTGSDYSIQGSGNVNLCGGTFIADCKNNILICDKFLLSGGTVTATTSIEITGGTTIATGLAYNAYNTDGSHYYMGSIGSVDLQNLGAVTLTPLPAVTLNETDGVTTLVSHVGEAVGVMFTRSFSGSKASTLCLPYDFEPKGGTFYEFTSVNDAWTEVTMTSVNPTSETPLTACKPYLFMPTADGQVDFTGIITNVASSYTAGTTTPDGSPWTFTGTYVEKRWDVNDNNTDRRIFGFATGQGYEGTAASTAAGVFIRLTTGGIKPFRAYLEYTGSLQARTRGEGGLPETMTVRLVNANGEIQGIGEIRLNTGEVTFDSRAWYDLNGRRLDGKPSEKGIYINGGRKVVIK